MSEKQEFVFDLSECYSPDDVHILLAESLPLPEYYGGNLDALHDVLSDPHPVWSFRFKGCKAAYPIVGSGFMKKFKRLMDAAVAEGNLEEVLWED